MTILVTGSSGKTSSRLAPLLPASHPPLVASRGGKSSTYPGVRFDWLDSSTYGLPFEHGLAKKSPITGVWLVAPPVTDPLPPMKAFIDFAKERGVKRFVLLSASSLDATGPMLGQVHAYLRDNVDEWAVLRPLWFMENFSAAQREIRIDNDGKIYSATQDGRLAFIAAEDIAAVAQRALLDEKPHNTDHIIMGPELLSYDDVAAIFSEVLGKQVQHVKLDLDSMTERFKRGGVPDMYASMLAGLDVAIFKGSQDHLNHKVEEVIGRPPKSLRDFVEENKEVWA